MLTAMKDGYKNYDNNRAILLKLTLIMTNNVYKIHKIYIRR